MDIVEEAEIKPLGNSEITPWKVSPNSTYMYISLCTVERYKSSASRLGEILVLLTKGE